MIVDSISPRDRIEQFANLKDRELKQIAYTLASESVDDKKHRRMDNAILYSVPIAAGIAAAAKTAPRIVRLGNFAAGTLGWALPFLAVDTVVLAKRGIEKHSQAARNFNEKHPMLSSLATLGLSIAGYMAFNKSLAKYVAQNESKIVKKVAPVIAKVEKSLESSKLLDKASKILAKVPSSAKDVSKSLLHFAPWALLFASLSHTMVHEKVKAGQYVNNYNELKDKQCVVRDALTNEV